MLGRGSELFHESQTYIDQEESLQILSSADCFEVGAVEASSGRHTYRTGIGVSVEDSDTTGHAAVLALRTGI